MTRRERWTNACQEIEMGIEQLRDLQAEYQEWKDNLPENLETSPVAEKLDAIIDMDIENLQSEVDEFVSADLPRGFGRD